MGGREGEGIHGADVDRPTRPRNIKIAIRHQHNKHRTLSLNIHHRTRPRITVHFDISIHERVKILADPNNNSN